MIRNGSTRRFLARSRSAAIEGNVFDEELAALLRLDDVEHGSDLRGCSPPAARRKMALGIATVEDPPLGGVTARDLEIPGPARPMKARLYVPDGLAKGAPGIFFVHGGGFVTGDLDTHDTLCRKLAKLGEARVFALDYRLAPEDPYPAACEDAVAGFRWLAKNAESLDVDPSRIGLTGDSAGGNLSAVVARLAAKDERPPFLHAPVYGAFDATEERSSHSVFAERFMLTKEMIDWYFDRYCPDVGRRREPDASPLRAESLAGISRAIVYVAGFDPLKDEGIAYHERLAAAGVPSTLVRFESLPHGFLLMTGVSRAAREATERVAREIGAALRV